MTSAVTFRGPRLEGATVSTDEGGFVRCLNRGYGWGMASFTSLDDLPAMVARAHELSLAVRLDDAHPPRRRAGARGGRGYSRSAATSAAFPSRRRSGTSRRSTPSCSGATAGSWTPRRPTATRWWSTGTPTPRARCSRSSGPRSTLSAVAVAREQGTIERALESLGRRSGWEAVQGREEQFLAAADRAVALLAAPRVRGGTYPVVLDPKLAGVFVHEAFGHLSEADFVYENPEAREMMTLGPPVRRAGADHRRRRERGRPPRHAALRRRGHAHPEHRAGAERRPRRAAPLPRDRRAHGRGAPPATPAPSRSGIRRSCG